MCTHTTQEAIGPAVDPNLGSDPLSASLTDAENAQPRTVSVAQPTGLGRTLEVLSGGSFDPSGGEDTVTPPWNPNGGAPRLTKFGMLARVIGPALEGGLIGLAGGNGHPGGGFGAANDFYDRQRAYQMQRALLTRQVLNDQFRNALDYARTQHTLNQPYFNGRGVAPIKGRDENGNLVYMRPNPQTGVYEPIEGITPDEADNSKVEMTDQGLVSVSPRTATARRVTIPLLPSISSADAQPGPDGNAPTGNIAPSEFDSGSPRIPLKPGAGTANQSPGGVRAAASQSIPLRPAGFSAPKTTIRASRNGSGVETDNVYDENPNSPTFGKQIGALGNTRQPLPDRTSNRTSKKDAISAAVEDHVDAVMQLPDVAGNPDKALNVITADKNIPAQYKPLMRNRIRELAKPGRPPKKVSALDLLQQQPAQIEAPQQ